MIEDDGYETIIPDLSAVKVEKVDRQFGLEVVDYFRNSHPQVIPNFADVARMAAEYRQAAYNQALKDAAEVASLMDYDLASAILSLGDKGNG